MFAHTAYEALYEYIGLALHEKFIGVITSQKIFLATLMMIFAVGFFMTAVHFFSRYFSGNIVQKRHIPLSKFIKITFCLFLGISLLKVNSSTSIQTYDRTSWHQNPYLQQKVSNIAPQYKVSFIFDLLSRTAEEISALLAKTVDTLFASSHSQLKAPNFFFKSILQAGSATIDDPNLRADLNFYLQECMDRAIPQFAEQKELGFLDKLFGHDLPFDAILEGLPVTMSNGTETNCNLIKKDVQNGLYAYAQQKSGDMQGLTNQHFKDPRVNNDQLKNLMISESLMQYFNEQREGFMGLQKGAQVPSGSGRWFQYLSRVFSWDGLLSIVTFGSTAEHGAALAAKRAQEFHENLTRAPHVQGAVKMILIFVFPWLVFVVVAGYWKSLVYWFLIYFSVLLWTPMWTLFYHIMVNLSLSTETLQSWSQLNDGISLYSAELISQKMNYMFAVFSWIQLLVGVGLSGSFLFILRPLLSDSEKETTPDAFGDAQSGAATVGKAATLIGG